MGSNKIIVLYHPGYRPGQSYPVASNVVEVLNGDRAICDDLVYRWSREEQDFYVVGRFDSRAAAEQFMAARGLESQHGF
jgi:hypothetical protein